MGEIADVSKILYKFHQEGNISRQDLSDLIHDLNYWKHKYKSEVEPVRQKNKEYRRLLKNEL